MIRSTQAVIVISIGILCTLADSLQIVCDDTTPALKSMLKCECTDSSGQGVNWWKGASIISTCSSDPALGCFSSPAGYEFQVNSSSKYFMEINSYTYSDCAVYKCTNLPGTSTSPDLDISISNTSLNLTQTPEKTETNTTGNITIWTDCLFISSNEVEGNIKTKWYTILNDSAEAYTSVDSTTQLEDTCQECAGVRARRLKVTLFYTEPISTKETEEVNFMLQIYDQRDPSNGRNITTSNKYIIPMAKNGDKEEDCRRCIRALALVFFIWAIFLVFDIPLLLLKYMHVEKGKVIRMFRRCPYFFPFALTSIFYLCYYGCRKPERKTGDIFIISITVVTDSIMVVVVLVYCKSEDEDDCNFLAVRVSSIVCGMIQLIGRLFVLGYGCGKGRMCCISKGLSEEAGPSEDHKPEDQTPTVTTPTTQGETSNEGRGYGPAQGRVAPLKANKGLNSRLQRKTDKPKFEKPVVPAINVTH